MAKNRSLEQKCFVDKIGSEIVERIEVKVRLVRVKLGTKGMPRSEQDFLQWQRHLRYNLDMYLGETYGNRVVAVEPPLGTNIKCKKNDIHCLEYDISEHYFVCVERLKKDK